MPRSHRHRATDLNLTPTRALPLLLEVERALGASDPGSEAQGSVRLYRNALCSVRAKLQDHVRYGLHKARKR